jgi:glycosyltransferase-like protein
MKIALFTYSTKPRGGVIHTIELGEALQAEGHQICIYALDKDNIGFHRRLYCPSKLVPTKPTADRKLLLHKKQNYFDGIVKNKHLDPVLDPVDELIKQRIQEFIAYLSQETEKYDIYHSQDCISTNALKVLRDRGAVANFIRTVHHIDEFNSPYLQACHDRSILEPDLCLCVSNYWRQQLQQQYQVDAPVILNGVDPRRFSSQVNGQETKLKQKLGIRGNPVYLTIGGIEPRKNSLKLLEAFIEVLNIHPQAQLIIAGGETLFDYEPYRLKFFQLAQRNKIKIGESLILPGVMANEDIPVLYRCADAFVFPSIKEGWGLVLLEAIASKLPIITSNVPPFTEFLEKKSALLVDPNSSKDIADAMVDILNKNLAQKLIDNSANIPSQYSWQKSAQMHLKHYSQLLLSG